MIGLLILASICYRFRKRGKRYVTALAIFGLYMLLAIAQVLFPIPIDESWPANVTWENAVDRITRINLIPFNYGTMFTAGLNPRIILFEIAGNILLTVPFGFGIGFLTQVCGKRLLLLALAAGAAFESAQLLIGLVMGYYYHSVDINDVMLNALGVLAGYAVYRVVDWIFPKGKRPIGKMAV